MPIWTSTPESPIFLLIRLALSRYQPYSLPCLALSQPVRADFIQLTPERTLTVKREAHDRYSIVLTGVSYVAELGADGAPPDL